VFFFNHCKARSLFADAGVNLRGVAGFSGPLRALDPILPPALAPLLACLVARQGARAPAVSSALGNAARMASMTASTHRAASHGFRRSAVHRKRDKRVDVRIRQHKPPGQRSMVPAWAGISGRVAADPKNVINSTFSTTIVGVMGLSCAIKGQFREKTWLTRVPYRI